MWPQIFFGGRILSSPDAHFRDSFDQATLSTLLFIQLN